MKKTLIYLSLAVISNNAFSQQDPMLSQYMFNGLYLNPAYAGSHKYWSSTITYRNQWVGIDGAPETGVVAVDGPIANKNMGLGALFMHDKIGVTQQNTFLCDYSYQLKINDNSKIALGVNAGVSQFSAKLTDLTVWDQDEVFESNLTSRWIPRFGAGAYYFGNKHYVGFSVPTLFAYQKEFDFNFDLSRATFLRRHYLLTGGYIFNVSNQFKLKPSALIKYVKSAPLEVDLNLSCVYKDMIWLGASYRTGDAIVFLAEYQTNSYFRVGYAYDVTLSKLRRYSSGSHEIMIGIDFGKDMVKVKTPRYF